MGWTELLLLAQTALIAGLALWLKSTIATTVESEIRHQFDQKLEIFRSGQARELELFRSDIALEFEVAKQRMAAMAEVWPMIAEFEVKLFAQARDFAMTILGELRTAGVPGIPETLPKGAQRALEALAPIWDDAVLTPDVLRRIETAAVISHKPLIEESERIIAALRARRFWLGAEVEHELRAYLDEMVDAFSRLSPAEEDRRAFGEAFQRLVKKRLTAAGVLGHKVDSAPSTSAGATALPRSESPKP